MTTIELSLTNDIGAVKSEHVQLAALNLELPNRSLASVSDNISQLTCLTRLVFDMNLLRRVPVGVLAMSWLIELNVRACHTSLACC